MAVMGALELLRKRSWRTGRLGWWSVTLVTILITAVSLASVAGARRTLSTYPDVLGRLGSADVQLGMGNPDEAGSLDAVDVTALPGVDAAGILRFHLAALVDDEGLLDPTSEVAVATPVDDVIWRQVERPLLLDGRLPAPHEVAAVAVTKRLADRLGLDVGDRLRIGLVTIDEVEVLMAGDRSVGARPELDVVGIVQPTDFSGDPGAPFATNAVLASSAFAEAHPGTSTFRLGYLRLAEGAAGVPALARELEARTGTGPDLGIRADAIQEVERAVRPEAVALGLLGVLTALGGVVVVAQAVGRQLASDRESNEVLAALGLTRRERGTAQLLTALVAIVPGVLAGTAVAVGASPLAPIGLVRPLDPSPGLRLDAGAHLGGAAILLASLAAAAGALAWRHSPLAAPPPTTRSPLLARTLAATTPPWNVAAALASVPGPARRHVRSLTVGLGAAVAVLVVAGIFTASSERLQSTPELYGQRYDLAVWDGYGALADDAIVAALEDDPAVADFGGVAETSAAIGAEESQLLGFALPHLAGTIVEGRYPTADDEIVLGLRLAARLGVGVGDDVPLAVGKRAGTAQVVGIGAVSSDMGNAAAMTLEGLRSVSPDVEVGWHYAELVPGTSQQEAQSRILAAFDECAVDCDVVTPHPPAAVSHLGRTGSMPVLLGIVAGVSGLLACLQGVVALVHRNRFTVALLQALGATGRRAARLTVAQTAYATGAAVVLGVPAGLVAGRMVWTALVERLGVVTSHAVPAAVLAAAIAAIAVAGHLAARLATRFTAGRPIAAELARGDGRQR